MKRFGVRNIPSKIIYILGLWSSRMVQFFH